MAKPDFATAYNKALAFQAAGDLAGISQLIQSMHRAGLPTDELRILSLLAEGAVQFQKPSAA